MTKVQAAFVDFPKVEAALKAKPEDGEANAKMASMLAARGKHKEAHEHLTRAEKGGLKPDALAPIYNAVADGYQAKEELDEALGLFRKADTAEAKAPDRSYAKISIVQCYLGKQDQEAAAKEARALIELKDAVPEHVRAARSLLKQLEG
jgi:tetratricopeptide (TPR) repeat protein